MGKRGPAHARLWGPLLGLCALSVASCPGCFFEPEPSGSPAPTASPAPTSPVSPTSTPHATPAPTPTPAGQTPPPQTPTPTATPPVCGAASSSSTNAWPAHQVPANLKGTGYQVGDVVPNFTLKDQNGQAVSLHQFYGRVIMLEFGTAWCAGCLESAPTAQQLYSSYASSCVMFISVLFQDAQGSAPTTSDLSQWATQYGLNFPVLGDGAQSVSQAFGFSAIPQYYFIDRQMTIRSELNQYPGDAALKVQIDALL